MKLTRAAAVLTGLVLALVLAPRAMPAEAADARLDVSISLRWDMTGTQGTWTPYVVTVKNPGATDFTGDVFLIPNESRNGPASAFPVHRSALAVARGSQRTLLFYVIDAPNGYRAQVRDAFSRVVGQAGVTSQLRGSSAFGILSDLPQAGQKIAAPLRTFSRVDAALARFSSAQSFPTNAVYLSGLNGLIIDQFDSASLSQAQVRALEDFVGLGGTLIEAAGSSWRRSLLPLPQDLLPMQPAATASASLRPLLDLAGQAGDTGAQVAVGQVRSGRVALAAADGTPLVVESAVGSGEVVELAFDPFGEPFDSHPDLAGLAWSQAISRALSSTQGAVRGLASPFAGVVFGGAGSGPAVAGPGVWAPGWGPSSQQLYELLNSTPAASSPPVGLLGGLLVAYVLLAGLLNYLFLKTWGRRGLMWVSVPAIALVFTAGAYVVGFGIRGSDFFVSEVQVQRPAPDGAVETYAFSGVFAPHRGDVRLALPVDTLASTAVTGAGFDTHDQSEVTQGARPQVLLQNVAIWNLRTLQTLSVAHPGQNGAKGTMPVEAHLRVESGKLKGTVQNRSRHMLRSVEVYGSSGSSTQLTPQLPPGATVEVSAAMPSGAGATSQAFGRPRSPASESGAQAALRLASTQALGGRPGELALVALTDPGDQLRVDGARPTRSSLAALVEPIRLQSADSLSMAPPSARLVSSFQDGGTSQVDVYDLDLPSGIKSGLNLGYLLLDTSQSTVRSVEVYDSASRSWRSLPGQRPPFKGPQSAPLGAGEVQDGVVRVRVREGQSYQANLSVTQR